MRLILAAALVAVSMSTPAGTDPGLELVESFVSDITSFRADFEQTLLGESEEVVERSTGTLEIQRPGRFRWDNVEPYEQWLIADGLNIWNYDVDLEQVTVKPQATALSNTPALILSGASDAFEQFDFIESYEEARHRWVRLEPKDPEAGFSRMELGFREGTLDRMVFFDNLGQTTLVQLTNVEVNEPIEASRFEFTVPPFADVIGSPVGED